MTVRIPTGTALEFDRFWRWLKDHPNCILEAGTAETSLNDHDSMHWYLYEDDDLTPVVQLILGKALIGELILDVSNVLFVQATAHVEGEQPGQFLFEVMAGRTGDSYAACHFLVAHGFDEEEIHHVGMAQ